jgi:type II secretory pathway pseudopilin PulG
MILKKTSRTRPAQQGYMLLSVMLAMTLILIAMAIEAPRIAQQIKRDKELELVHRGKDVATAIKHFVHKNGGRYPNSLEQLEDTNHIRYLRRRWKDPTTGESIWRLVHVGEAEIKIPTTSPGLNPNTNNPGLTGSGNPGLSSSTPVPNTTAPVLSANGPQANPQQGNTGQLGSLTTSNIGNGQTIGGGQIMGIASVNKAKSILEFNDKDEYDEWFFVYDLRLEQAGGTGVTVASPRAGADTSSQGDGQAQRGGTAAPGAPQPSGTPAPPPQVPQ